ncbi:MAG: hypothetical protein BGO14_02695 [Chlamydiales bacterium 38-26]|nr:hypothetical protein [Chlamydiales bacterium]OJV09259.1 MAG: hypothetical protein BGO14_02695 [Chlamydiales bacterium 38-26]
MVFTTSFNLRADKTQVQREFNLEFVKAGRCLDQHCADAGEKETTHASISVSLHFTDLAEKTHAHVFTYLSDVDLRNISQVNRACHQLAGRATVDWINQRKKPLAKLMKPLQLENLLKLHGERLQYCDCTGMPISANKEILYRIIALCPNITHLHLKECGLSDQDMDIIIKHPNVKVLNVSSNGLTSKGIEKLVQSTFFLQLTQLNLSQNFIGDDLGSLMFKQDGELEVLNISHDLSSKKIGKKTVTSIVEKMRLKKLRILHLDHNHLDDECIDLLFSKKSPSIQLYTISGNPAKEMMMMEIPF